MARRVIDCSSAQSALRRIMENPDSALPDEVALHLDACDRCRRTFDRGRVDLDSDAFEGLPPSARARILEVIGAARSARPRRRRAVMAAAALVVVAAGALYVALQGTPSDSVTAALIEDHIRYLDHPDRHGGLPSDHYRGVLESYVDFPVRIPDLGGARLTGARRCYLLGRRVALAFYEAPGGSASYFVFAAPGLALPGTKCSEDGFRCAATQGYHLVTWEEAGLMHAFVGPDETELMAMARDASGAHVRPAR